MLKVLHDVADMSDEHEQLTSRHTQLEYLAESDELYPFSPCSRSKGISGDARQAECTEANCEQIGKGIANLVRNASSSNSCLEVAWGGNGYPAKGFQSITQGDVVLLDYTRFDTTESFSRRGVVPQAVGNGSITAVTCEFSDIDSSAVAERQFGCILFYGSLFGSGMNWTMSQYNSSRADMDEHSTITNALQTAKAHLAEDGAVVVVSDRYALYSPGRSESELITEREQFSHLIEEAQRQGAKSIKIVGTTRQGLQSSIEAHVISTTTTAELAATDKDTFGEIALIDAIVITF